MLSQAPYVTQVLNGQANCSPHVHWMPVNVVLHTREEKKICIYRLKIPLGIRLIKGVWDCPLTCCDGNISNICAVVNLYGKTGNADVRLK